MWSGAAIGIVVGAAVVLILLFVMVGLYNRERLENLARMPLDVRDKLLKEAIASELAIIEAGKRILAGEQIDLCSLTNTYIDTNEGLAALQQDLEMVCMGRDPRFNVHEQASATTTAIAQNNSKCNPATLMPHVAQRDLARWNAITGGSSKEAVNKTMDVMCSLTVM